MVAIAWPDLFSKTIKIIIMIAIAWPDLFSKTFATVGEF